MANQPGPADRAALALFYAVLGRKGRLVQIVAICGVLLVSGSLGVAIGRATEKKPPQATPVHPIDDNELGKQALECCAAARQDDVSIEDLELWGMSDNHYVRMWVAENHRTPQATIDLLSRDQYPDVKYAAVGNPNISVEALMLSLHDPDPIVQNWAADNVKMPAGVLARLAKGTNEMVQASVADNPNTPKDVLVTLSRSPDPIVRDSVAANPHTPTPVLLRLAHDVDKNVRQDAKNLIVQRN